ncbi:MULTISPECIES: hypothetical protein [Bacillus cereus group]|uniref:hypothetical protein n=1 Tax=Bacillus cereus group TaxID=86661 RepID=UPI001ADDAD3B|nr:MULTISPECIES: hypothetical protein [Bacillus cereus group]MEB8646213.1 hypothetical protein [Bacillus cereus]MCC3939760.1 hypothetical protein [Bacillus thuringiensis]MCC3958607.1 hypothetical protein [Bacillus thuringiensis]MEB9095081.1 hypothetical protein [Bacillus cereus]MEB9471245.1 hypothetical protein [Bacillus cereus]
MRNPYDYYITPEEYEIAEKNGVCASTLRSRIYDLCWSKERAIDTPPIKNHLWREVKDVALSNGIAMKTFEKRIKLGWDFERAINTPILSRSQVAIMAKEASPWSKGEDIHAESI